MKIKLVIFGDKVEEGYEVPNLSEVKGMGQLSCNVSLVMGPEDGDADRKMEISFKSLLTESTMAMPIDR